jgi:UDP-glucose 4-epimerase
MPDDILITGVNGFLGRHTAAEAHALGWRVWGVDRSGVAPDFLHAYLPCPLPSPALVSFIEDARPAYCVHLAGMASVALSFQHPDLDFASGPPSVFSLLDSLRQSSPNCRVAFASSAAVYGNPASLPVTETHELHPISPYGFHKLQSELILREFYQLYRIPTVSLRLFSAYGEGLRKQVLWDMCRQVIQSGQLHLRGTGGETRDFIHGRDAARGILTALRQGQLDGRAYNLAAGTETSIHQLANIVTKALESPVQPTFDGFVPPGDPLHWRADVTAMTALGFLFDQDLEAGVTHYAQWCRQILNESP